MLPAVPVGWRRRVGIHFLYDISKQRSIAGNDGSKSGGAHDIGRNDDSEGNLAIAIASL